MSSSDTETPTESRGRPERTLREGFLRSLRQFPEREALNLGGESLTYTQLCERAERIAATLDRFAPVHESQAGQAGQEGGASQETPPRLTAIFGHRHPSAFAGVLGALFRGHGYVPLNPTFPVPRSRAMLERSGCGALVVDATATSKVAELLEGFSRSMLVLAPDLDNVSELREALPDHQVLGAEDLLPGAGYALGASDHDDIAYLLFTSGSTGDPKGVMVAHRNVTHFVDVMVERYGITEADRFSQTFDLTFDLSVFDMFCAWERGACLCVPTAQEKLFPSKYVKKQALSVWFSVPSTGVLMSRLRMLKPESYPSLRWTLFCGEALPCEIADKFASAAPNSTVENLYGPTELTIACTLYTWRGADSVAESLHGVVPIGEPYPGMRAIVVDTELKALPRGDAGELLLAGPQVTPGYWNDQERTDKAFVVPPGETEVYYRTGDRVTWPEGGPLLYLGRVDNQIKIQGYRVELGEIEAVLREVSGAEVAIALGWPVTPSGADGVVGFISAPVAAAPTRPAGSESPESATTESGEESAAASADPGQRAALAAKTRLPSYMQPSRVLVVDEFPLNSNGKVDRKALLARLEDAS